MTQIEQKNASKKFVENWNGKGYEKGESQKFWLDLLCNVFGIQDFSTFVFFENQIKDKIQDKTITNFIDVYIPSTKVMIEQKSSGKDLRKPIKQSDGSFLTPFQQAKKYIAGLPLSSRSGTTASTTVSSTRFASQTEHQTARLRSLQCRQTLTAKTLLTATLP